VQFLLYFVETRAVSRSAPVSHEACVYSRVIALSPIVIKPNLREWVSGRVRVIARK